MPIGEVKKVAGGIQVHKSLPSMTDSQRRLTTLEPRVDGAMLLLTLVTATGRLSVARGGTATDADALLVGALVLLEVGEDGCAAGL